ncbi:Protein of unknown function [Gryllus bimaculatus]|nr:Protein of unknown function [Gryllus bimaculatus]
MDAGDRKKKNIRAEALVRTIFCAEEAKHWKETAGRPRQKIK